jgi:hypothetical protein
MGLVTIVLIIGGFLLAMWLAVAVWLPEDPSDLPGFDSRGVITSLL